MIGLAGVAAGDEVRIGGILPLDPGRASLWCWSGTFRFPVGDPRELGLAGPDSVPPYQVNRGIGDRGGHQGADLDNNRGGDPVRAASHGLVLTAGDGWNGGYGTRVVLAHRLPDETLVYSVYSHLEPGTVRVRIGEPVHAGQALGLVGRSGRATTEHLHFEVRSPANDQTRWEHARVVDPIAFVTARLTAPPDTGATAACMAWAEDAALILSGASPGAPLDRARWWTMLARTARHELARLPDDPAGLGPALVAAGLLPADAAREGGGEVPWTEFQRDLDRLRAVGSRLPPLAPGRAPGRSPRAGKSPTLAQACAMLADVSAPAATGSTRETTTGSSKRP